ncbi:unnamed protein product, partial [Oikopleura dioica]
MGKSRPRRTSLIPDDIFGEQVQKSLRKLKKATTERLYISLREELDDISKDEFKIRLESMWDAGLIDGEEKRGNYTFFPKKDEGRKSSSDSSSSVTIKTPKKKGRPVKKQNSVERANRSITEWVKVTPKKPEYSNGEATQYSSEADDSDASVDNDVQIFVDSRFDDDQAIPKIDPANVEYFIERQGDPKTLPRSPQKAPTDKKSEITLLSKTNWNTTDPDVIHFRCYIKLLRNIIRRMKKESQNGTTISAIDKYIQQNFWLEGVELGEFKSQLRLAIGRGVTKNLLVRMNHDSNKFHRIELGSDDSEDDEELAETQTAPPMPICLNCYGTARYNLKATMEYLISCRTCGSSYHPSCIRMSPECAAWCYKNGWDCDECKVCRICCDPVDGETGPYGGAVCSQCDVAAHWKCERVVPSKKQKYLNCPEHKSFKPKKFAKSSRQRIPSIVKAEVTPEPLLDEAKVERGLHDAMSKYFTPSPEGRKTRTAQGHVREQKQRKCALDPIERPYRPIVTYEDQ